MPINIFCCYAHEDGALLKKLKSHMNLLQRQGFIHFWHDGDISAGVERESEITKHLYEAQLILLLISPDFIGSDYCYSSEMQRAIERYEAGAAQVIPILLRPTDLKGSLFEKLQTLPSAGKPVTSWRNRDEAFFVIVQGIRAVVEQVYAHEKTRESPHTDNSSIITGALSQQEDVPLLAKIIPSPNVLQIPLLAENLAVDSHQLKKNLQAFYGSDGRGLSVSIDMHDLGAKVIEIAEKIGQGIETDEIKIAGDQRSLFLQRIRDRSELWPICFPMYEANLAALLSRLVGKLFSPYKNPLERLTLTRASLENTLEYIRYQLTAYLQGVVPSSFAHSYGFPAIATYLGKYEGFGSGLGGVQKALEEIYRYQNITIDSPERVYVVESKKKNTPFWQVYFPHIYEDDRYEIMYNCKPSTVIDGYTWDVFFLPQIIGNALTSISFGEGKRVEELPYTIGLSMKDYEYIGFP